MAEARKVFEMRTFASFLKGQDRDGGKKGVEELVGYMTQSEIDEELAPFAAALAKAWIYEQHPELARMTIGDLYAQGQNVSVPTLPPDLRAEVGALSARLSGGRKTRCEQAARLGEAEKELAGVTARLKDADARAKAAEARAASLSASLQSADGKALADSRGKVAEGVARLEEHLKMLEEAKRHGGITVATCAEPSPPADAPQAETVPVAPAAGSEAPLPFTKIPELFFLRIKVPQLDVPTTFAFSVFKAGSVLMNKMLSEACDELGISFVDLPGFSFGYGFDFDAPEMADEVSRIFKPRGYCYGGFRMFPRNARIPIIKEHKKCLLVRDPRDILVSHFFSMKNSHPAPGVDAGDTCDKVFTYIKDITAEGIDKYVLRVSTIISNSMKRYTEIIDDENLRLYRYEDVVFSKKEWLTDMMQFLEWPLPPEQIAAISAANDIRPDKEDQARHIRKVTPGDHKEKLQPETIAALNEKFEPVFRLYGYSA
jgi:hypothetical protein